RDVTRFQRNVLARGFSDANLHLGNDRLLEVRRRNLDPVTTRRQKRHRISTIITGADGALGFSGSVTDDDYTCATHQSTVLICDEAGDATGLVRLCCGDHTQKTEKHPAC